MEEKKKIYPKLFLLVGPSGCGKNFYCESLKLTNIPSYTTRGIRPGEVEGREHVFKTFEDWDKISSSKNFEKQIVAWTIFHDNAYWTLMSDINKKQYDAFIVDPAGIDTLLKYKEKYPDAIKRELVIIQFKAPKYKLYKRMYGRFDGFKDLFKKNQFIYSMKKTKSLDMLNVGYIYSPYIPIRHDPKKEKTKFSLIVNIKAFFKTLKDWTPIENMKKTQSRLEHDVPIFKDLESKYDIAYTIYT